MAVMTAPKSSAPPQGKVVSDYPEVAVIEAELQGWQELLRKNTCQQSDNVDTANQLAMESRTERRDSAIKSWQLGQPKPGAEMPESLVRERSKLQQAARDLAEKIREVENRLDKAKSVASLSRAEELTPHLKAVLRRAVDFANGLADCARELHSIQQDFVNVGGFTHHALDVCKPPYFFERDGSFDIQNLEHWRARVTETFGPKL